MPHEGLKHCIGGPAFCQLRNRLMPKIVQPESPVQRQPSSVCATRFEMTLMGGRVYRVLACRKYVMILFTCAQLLCSPPESPERCYRIAVQRNSPVSGIGLASP
jgi:hypothetical protein